MSLRIIKHVGILAAATALALGATAANAVTISTLTFFGVTWTATSVDADTMTLRIQNALTGPNTDPDPENNWQDITHLWTLSVNPTGTVTSATISPTGTFSGLEMSSNGCSGGTSGKACFIFDPFLALSNDMLFTIDFVGTGLNLTDIVHIKVGFQCSPTTAGPVAESGKGKDKVKGTKACGDLMSKDTSIRTSTSTGQVPEPGTMALLGLGLVGLGFLRRRKA